MGDETKDSNVKKFAGVVGLVLSVITLVGLVFQAGMSYSKLSGTNARLNELANEVRVIRENLLRRGFVDPVESRLPSMYIVSPPEANGAEPPSDPHVPYEPHEPSEPVEQTDVAPRDVGRRDVTQRDVVLQLDLSRRIPYGEIPPRLPVRPPSPDAGP